MNRTKREVISVWPASSERKPYKALVKITFGESISLFPLSLMEGKHGYYLQLPKANRADGTRSLVGRFLYSDANRMLTEKVLRAYLPGTPLCREYQMNEKLHISFRVFPHSMQVDRQVAVASMELNHKIRIEGIRMFQLSERNRLILFPERQYSENGETVIKRIVDFKQEKEEEIIKELWRIYDARK